MYVLSNGASYIGLVNNVATSVALPSKAIAFATPQKARNYLNNLKATLKKFSWEVTQVEDKPDSDADIHARIETEKTAVDVYLFFKNNINTASKLYNYINHMCRLERRYNKKIMDVRHYKRDMGMDLNDVQKQKLEEFEILIEQERYGCKINRIIALYFLADIDRLGDFRALKVIEKIRESKYKPKVLTYKFLDEVVGRK